MPIINMQQRCKDIYSYKWNKLTIAATYKYDEHITDTKRSGIAAKSKTRYTKKVGKIRNYKAALPLE